MTGSAGKLDLAPLHCAGNVVGLPDGQRNDSQRRVARGAGRELAPVRHEQVLDVVRLTVFVDPDVTRLLAHPVGPEVVSARMGRRRERTNCADCIVDRCALLPAAGNLST
jgi:hypothetical protein